MSEKREKREKDRHDEVCNAIAALADRVRDLERKQSAMAAIQIGLKGPGGAQW